MTTSDTPRVVRSYQRIFSPERRIYAIDGRTLPIPGGIPLRWLGWALASLLAGLILAGGSRLVIVLLAVAAGLAAVRAGRARLAPAMSAVTALGSLAAGETLRLMDWPLRLVVVPAFVATAMTQITPDGRPMHRYMAGLLAARLRGWRSAGRPIADPSRTQQRSARVRVASDEHTPKLRRARICGPASVSFARPIRMRRRRGRLVVRALPSRRGWGLVMDRVRVKDGEQMRVQR